MRKPPTIGEFSLSFALSPSSRRGVYTVTRGDASTPYSIEKHALWCLFLDGKALPCHACRKANRNRGELFGEGRLQPA